MLSPRKSAQSNPLRLPSPRRACPPYADLRVATPELLRAQGAAPTSAQRSELTREMDFEAPPVFLRAASRPVELSLQSSLQLSLTVLVCYRSRGRI